MLEPNFEIADGLGISMYFYSLKKIKTNHKVRGKKFRIPRFRNCFSMSGAC